MMRKYVLAIMTGEKKGPAAFLLRCVFFLLSIIYRVGYEARAFLYDAGIFKAKKLNCAVISVGNITLGGVGKTPLVQLLVKILQRKEYEVGVLIRGYMPRNTAAIDSDEAVMLSENLPGTDIVVGKDRVKNARKFLENRRLDAFILDDGFGHRKLARNLDIVAVDATNPFGNGHVLPMGILREPVAALKRAHMIVLTKTDLNQEKTMRAIKALEKKFPDKKIYLSIHKPESFYCLQTQQTFETDIFTGQKVCLLSSIGEPKTFEQTVEKLDCQIDKHFKFMDHHIYQKNEIIAIVDYCYQHKISKIITTQKDVVKLRAFESVFTDNLLWFQLNIQLEIVKEENEFINRITRVL